MAKEDWECSVSEELLAVLDELMASGYDPEELRDEVTM